MVANQFARDIQFKKLFYRYTIDLWKYGDAVDLIKFNSRGIVSLQPLPMMHVTAVDKRSQINASLSFNDEMIQNPKWYVVDEGLGATDVKDQFSRVKEYFILVLTRKENLIRDNKGRWTFGVWSTAPN